MLSGLGRVSAIIVMAGGAVLGSADEAKASMGVRPCTPEEYSSTCHFGTGSGYFDGQEWWCPGSYTCLWDDDHNEPAGYVTYYNQPDPCTDNTQPCA